MSADALFFKMLVVKEVTAAVEYPTLGVSVPVQAGAVRSAVGFLREEALGLEQ